MSVLFIGRMKSLSTRAASWAAGKRRRLNEHCVYHGGIRAFECVYRDCTAIQEQEYLAVRSENSLGTGATYKTFVYKLLQIHSSILKRKSND
jgi:hypothetical protein